MSSTRLAGPSPSSLNAASSVQTMLERMKELATQAASDTVDSNGRGRINDEFTQLAAEIDRTVDMQRLEEVLMQEGLAKFADPFKALVKLIGEKRAK